MEKVAFKYETGVIHGRFQVLHHDHLKYLLAGKELCRHLVVGITNPDPVMVREESADIKRSSFLANPLTYYERYTLIRTVLLENGVKAQDLSVVPLPINLLLTIYDDWGRKKLGYFKSLQLKTHVLWEVLPGEKGLSANDIRNYMIHEKPWQHLVPQSVAALLIKWRIPQRLKKTQEKL